MTDRDQPMRSARLTVSVAVRSAVNREVRGVFIMFSTHTVSTHMAARNIYPDIFTVTILIAFYVNC